MLFHDKMMWCRDCGAEYVFTAGEQAFYVEKGLMNEPHRCAACRADRRRERATAKEGTKIVCSSCGREGVVPFVPRLERPVYCDPCYQDRRLALPL